MLNSTILDVAIGLVFCFASVALFVSAVHEGIASLLKLRHETLLTGIKQLLNDPNGTGLALKLYNHALVNPLTTPATATDPNAKLAMPAHGDLPAYISSTDFASALLDVLPNAPKDFAAVQASVETITDLQLKQLLQGMLARAENDLNTLRKHIADWFDNAMDRLSGGYKRQTQLVTFLLGLFAAGLLNINAIFVLEKLWERPSLAAALSSPDSVKMIAAVAKSPLVAASASSSAAAAADSGKSLDDWSAALGKLPVGWTNGPQIPGAADANTALGVLWLWLVLVGGWFVTATAAVFGAPFWFDLLQKLIQVRGTGTKPAAARDKS